MKKTGYINPCILMILFVWCCISCDTEENHIPKAKGEFLLGGIQVNEPDQQEWMSVMKDAEMNTVSITVYARNYYWDQDIIQWDSMDIPNLIHEIRTAKENGMKVVFIPRVLLDHYFDYNRFLWHGMILPSSDSLIQNWMERYTTYITEWAKICEAEGVDVFAIGSELRMLSQTQTISKIPALEKYYLNSSEQEKYISDRMAYKDSIPSEYLWVKGEDVTYEALENFLKDEVEAKVKWAKSVAYDTDENPIGKINHRRNLLLSEWTELIKKVRNVYSGKLTYAANFDNYQNIAFWDQLDFIGINAYFKLRNNPEEINHEKMYQRMKKSWDAIFQDMLQFQEENNLDLPVFFTELGYTFKKNCTIMPWEGFGFSIIYSEKGRDIILWDQQEENLQERALAIKSLREINLKYGLLQGILYWKISANKEFKSIEPFLMVLDKENIDPMLIELQEFNSEN